MTERERNQGDFVHRAGRLITALTVAAGALVINVSQAHNAQADGLLDGLLGGDILTQQLCTPVQSGVGNQFTAPQNTQCNQGASSSTTTPAGGGITGYEVVKGGNFSLLPGESDSAAIFCPAGKRPLSGGVQAGGGDVDNLRLKYSYVHQIDPTEWVVGVTHEGGQGAAQGNYFVICANVAE
ncbi:hypothetical protein [Streptomyces sp. NPDC001381]|uniref:hypothetical protein n=1 Tax=Streptomyces sp. NPDC001381 TaxID=3364567 RepID=UPI0036ADEB55